MSWGGKTLRGPRAHGLPGRGAVAPQVHDVVHGRAGGPDVAGGELFWDQQLGGEAVAGRFLQCAAVDIGPEQRLDEMVGRLLQMMAQLMASGERSPAGAGRLGDRNDRVSVVVQVGAGHAAAGVDGGLGHHPDLDLAPADERVDGVHAQKFGAAGPAGFELDENRGYLMLDHGGRGQPRRPRQASRTIWK